MALIPAPEDALTERLRRRIAGEDMTGVTAALTPPSDMPPPPPIPTPPDLGNAGDVSRAVAAMMAPRNAGDVPRAVAAAITSDQLGPSYTLPGLASADPTMAAMGVPPPDLVAPPPDPSARIAQAMLGSQAPGGDAGTAFESRPYMKFDRPPYMIDPWNRLWVWDDKAKTWVPKFGSDLRAPPPAPPKPPTSFWDPLLRFLPFLRPEPTPPAKPMPPTRRNPLIGPDDPRYPPPPSRYRL